MPKRIPFIDETYWEKVNPYLSQLLTPENGGINLWTNATRPSGLLAEDIGRTGWNTDTGCLQRWNGTSWENLQPSLTTLGPIITEIFESWNPVPPPQWLIDLILNTISTWNPSPIPQWLIDAINAILNALSLSDIVNLLNQWTPSQGSPVDLLIDAAMTSGGLTEAQAINIINNWSSAIPTWLANYINSRLTGIALSQLAGNATLPQIQTALTQWYNNVLKPYIDGLVSIGNLGGNASLAQIQAALDSWFNSNLKPYIDTGDANAKAYGDQIRATLLTKVDANYNDLLNRINTHGHTGGVTTTPSQTTTTPPPQTTTTTTQTPTPPPTTTLPSSAWYQNNNNYDLSEIGTIAFVGTGIETSTPVNISAEIDGGSEGQTTNITIIRVPGKINGVNNIPATISYANLIAATGAQYNSYSLQWAAGQMVSIPTINVKTTQTSSDYGYNIYMRVNTTTHAPTTLRFRQVITNASAGKTILYNGPVFLG